MDARGPNCDGTPPKKVSLANIAGLTSPVQQAEMKLLVARRWPPLKPLPVFKYETEVYRASIEFDKMRGEWVCRKTSFPSNKVQELRGGLTELTMALPHGRAEVSTEDVAGELPEQELEKDANRRRQTMREWREKYENGGLYSELRVHLSESQKEEIDEYIRLSLTARQLQFNAKNVAYVFDALSKAGGRLASLMESAQRKKAGEGADAAAQAGGVTLEVEQHVAIEEVTRTHDRRLHLRTTPSSLAHVKLNDTNGGVVLNISETGMAVAASEALLADGDIPGIQLQLPRTGQYIEFSAEIVWLAESKKDAGFRFVDLTAEARDQISNWIASEKLTLDSVSQMPAGVESPISATFKSNATELIGGISAGQEHACFLKPMVSQARKKVTPEIVDARPPAFGEYMQEKAHDHTPAASFEPQAPRGKVDWSANRIGETAPQGYGIEISGTQVAAVVIFVVGISLTAWLTVGRSPLGKSVREAREPIQGADARSPALPDRLGETISRTSSGADKLEDVTPGEKKSTESARESASVAQGPPADSNSFPITESKPAANPEVDPRRNRSTGLSSRNAPRIQNPQHARPPKAPRRASSEARTPAPWRGTSALRSSSSIVLVTGPGDGSKPFRLTLPEKTIAASSSFAMTAQLSVLVTPEPGRAMARRPERLEGGELIGFVWPRYPSPGERTGSAETLKVRMTIGQLGQVLDVKMVSGSKSLFPAAMSAIRQWRYKPTLLNKRPVQAQEDVTIEFRPPEYLARVSNTYSSHK